MLPFRLIYRDDYFLPIGEHVFPAAKYRLIKTWLLEHGAAAAEDFIEPQPASDEDILLVHTSDYVNKLKTGTISAREELQLEVPYSPELVRAFWLAAGGSIKAAECALLHKCAVSIGGGFHHAFPDHGEGFCMIHDVAVAIRRLQKDKRITRAMTVDCDVHQGNGTAAIFSGVHEAPARSHSWSGAMFGMPEEELATHNSPDPSVFTISLHQEHNYPSWKPPSSIDVNLPDGTGDDEYLSWLDNAISSGLRKFEPDLLCYIAGADPYREDQLGGLALTIAGLKQRDLFLFRVARERQIPVMVTFAGGYARRLEDTVQIHCNTILAAKEIFGG
jgi:acetoin utilization deacetylase AcuC-like enzyme